MISHDLHVATHYNSISNRQKRKTLGQHFLVSPHIAERIVSEANITKKDTVFELGTGSGALTLLLCQKAKKVISVDYDADLLERAKESMSQITNLTLECRDGLATITDTISDNRGGTYSDNAVLPIIPNISKNHKPFTIFVSNLPYSRSKDAIQWLAQTDFSHGVIMVQREFAEKILTGASSTPCKLHTDDNSILNHHNKNKQKRRAVSVIAQYCFEIKVLFDVNKHHFLPPPKVDSVVLYIKKKNNLSAKQIKIINNIFSYRRKTLKSILEQFGVVIDTELNQRVDSLTITQIIHITNKIIINLQEKKSGIIQEDEYMPSEDTFFVADYISTIPRSGGVALDVGSGSGYLTRLLSENFDLVVGTDINFGALAKQTYKTDHLVCCSGSDAIHTQFDLVVCNLPYLATDDIACLATDGGPGGLQVPTRILKSVCRNIKQGGKFIFVTSSLSDYNTLITRTKLAGLEPRIIARKKLFFEELLLVEAQKA